MSTSSGLPAGFSTGRFAGLQVQDSGDDDDGEAIEEQTQRQSTGTASGAATAAVTPSKKARARARKAADKAASLNTTPAATSRQSKANGPQIAAEARSNGLAGAGPQTPALPGQKDSAPVGRAATDGAHERAQLAVQHQQIASPHLNGLKLSAAGLNAHSRTDSTTSTVRPSLPDRTETLDSLYSGASTPWGMSSSSVVSTSDDEADEPATARPARDGRHAPASLETRQLEAATQASDRQVTPTMDKRAAEPTAKIQPLSPKSSKGAKLDTPGQHGTDHDPAKKWQSVMTRIVWSLIMVTIFITILLLGHVYVILLTFVSSALVFRELTDLFDGASSSHHHEGEGRERSAAHQRRKAERERWSRITAWYFFISTNYFLYGETIIYYFKHIVLIDTYFIPFARHHRFISFMLYVIGFVGFVGALKRNQLRRQFGLFCWIHMSLLVVVVSSHFIVNNILEGLIWFWIPASLVIMNDVAAYFFGMTMGRTQLIKLSPKKTVEGFVGAFFATVVFSYFWGTLFMRFTYLTCPATDLGTSAFSTITCSTNPVFTWREWPLPQGVAAGLSTLFRRSITVLPWSPFQLHCLVMAVFASLVAPFGGFFASGFKRAFNIKDFGDSIPGHGGITDRMDCQFLMGLFSYVYYSSLIREHHINAGTLLQSALTALTTEEQVELLRGLHSYLSAKGVGMAL
ncbi:uncharacterized protein L969DRAFT_86355 [Mixia osmundae IAM 14324]|uniref:Phosphatidate cytidylyltransferase n=1 Tax=Mixia osmundae (strain CBS 9802 / IAM 14324 / JCM 22182 / KY 12970) TaxID=764103 RepID=G7DUI0_MIXOS|nr:uncharacterized protein L969DRAFT_86355 [Mixia osmundae IAM 14324]KEI41112.1 hypothetical protein L969DRAFT_86355 [Mixia osmundae IAM 14324]GAA94240.1 hypothetical protein E5Q_00889 [Mixia osmundae IAM 14324]